MKNLIVFFLFVVGVFFGPGLAQAYVVDGNLNDWGVRPGTWASSAWGTSDWTPNAGVRYTVEDQDPAVNYLNPGSGAQAFDAEAMYAAYDGTNLYYAIVTGKNPDTTSGYRPGDIAFDFGSNGSFEKGIETTGSSAGDLYSVSSWKYGLFNNSDPTEMNVKSKLGDGTLAYNNSFYGTNARGSHYVIEGYIPTSYFGSNWGNTFTMSWTQTCGNDVIRLNVTPTPEPASMALFGIGLAGMGFLRRKKLVA